MGLHSASTVASAEGAAAHSRLLCSHKAAPDVLSVLIFTIKNQTVSWDVALQTCWRMYQPHTNSSCSIHAGRQRQPSPRSAVLLWYTFCNLWLEYFCTFLAIIKPCLLLSTGIYFYFNAAYSPDNFFLSMISGFKPPLLTGKYSQVQLQLLVSVRSVSLSKCSSGKVYLYFHV